MSDLAVAVPPAHADMDSQDIEYVVGDVVDVARRMWPGVNKPGGVGRITKIRHNEADDTYLYDVAYVLGARETKIHSSFFTLLNDDGSRKRSIVGRCKFCKSFFKDCGHDQTAESLEDAEAALSSSTPLPVSSTPVSLKRVVSSSGIKQPPKEKEVKETKEARSSEHKVRRYNSAALTEVAATPTSAMSRTVSADVESAAYHSDSEGEGNGVDEEGRGSLASHMEVSGRRTGGSDKKRQRRADFLGTPLPMQECAFFASPPPPRPTAVRRRLPVDQVRAGANYYGLSRLDPSNRDIAYNSMVLDMHNTNRVVKLIENLNCIKKFTVHGEDQSTTYSLLC